MDEKSGNSKESRKCCRYGKILSARTRGKRTWPLVVGNWIRFGIAPEPLRVVGP